MTNKQQETTSRNRTLFLTTQPNLVRGKCIDSAWALPPGTARARRGTLPVVELSFWTAFTSLSQPLIHYSKIDGQTNF